MTERGREQPPQSEPVEERSTQEGEVKKQGGPLRHAWERVKRRLGDYPVEKTITEGGSPKWH